MPVSPLKRKRTGCLSKWHMLVGIFIVCTLFKQEPAGSYVYPLNPFTSVGSPLTNLRLSWFKWDTHVGITIPLLTPMHSSSMLSSYTGLIDNFVLLLNGALIPASVLLKTDTEPSILIANALPSISSSVLLTLVLLASDDQTNPLTSCPSVSFLPAKGIKIDLPFVVLVKRIPVTVTECGSNGRPLGV